MARAAGGLNAEVEAGPGKVARTDAGAVEVDLQWLGHSTVVVRLPGLTVLTDPLLRERLGPLRRHGPVPDPAALPAPDVVLISHAHPDHFDRPSLAALPGDPLVLAPRGLARAVRRASPRLRTREVRVGEAVEHGPWSIRAVRARHWRWPLFPAAPAVGYLVEGPVGIYFAGDTGEFPAMRELAGRVDVALLPVGRWGPQPTPGHLTPESAARVAAVIGASVVLPIHWGTLYPVALERLAAGALREPAERFRRAASRVAPSVVTPDLAPGDTTRMLVRTGR